MTTKKNALFTSLEHHIDGAIRDAVELKLDEHFISDLKHLMSVAKANRSEP